MTRALLDLHGEADEDLLASRSVRSSSRRRLAGAEAALSVAPHSCHLGVMLPYAPLQHLLLGDFGRPLVMTSANLSDEPIAYTDDDARLRLGGIADALLVHDRPIHMRTDDSVVRVLEGRRPLVLRRSRGYVPQSLRLPLGRRAHPRLRRRAQEHVLRRKGRGMPGSRITLATSRTGRRSPRSAKESSTSSVSLRSSRE